MLEHAINLQHDVRENPCVCVQLCADCERIVPVGARGCVYGSQGLWFFAFCLFGFLLLDLRRTCGCLDAC